MLCCGFVGLLLVGLAGYFMTVVGYLWCWLWGCILVGLGQVWCFAIGLICVGGLRICVTWIADLIAFGFVIWWLWIWFGFWWFW